MKNSNIEILRIVMSLFVILLHQAGPIYNMSYSDVWYFKYFCPWVTGATIFFILITGYLKVDTKRYNNSSFIITILISWIINFILACIIYSFTRDKIPFIHLLLGGRDWWYIWALLVIHLLMPILNKILHSFNKNYLLICVLVLYMILEFTSNYFYGQYFGITNIVAMVLLYIVGGIIKMHFKLSNIFQFVLILLIVSLLWILIVFINLDTSYDFVYKQIGILNAIFSILVFIIVVSLKPFNNKLLNYLGSSMLYVYLYHYLAQEINDKYLLKYISFLDIQLQIFILAMLTFLFSILFALLLVKPINKSSIFISKKLNLLNKKNKKFLSY
ncbi:hypothetical protein SCORR_v1c06430 [Spiroplasma corruscae]|uniref:Acyltransferase 3 domain-containing protein n=1 Tax=Spiroplasma corruscae TaxID=216934 RepID=A0A222EPG0_9MOLU|nr:acyltransferase family protein [Spiroplasma corruscae]ASP28415.1 hypothetical protein SCORR_v1c06430 [Spiroplasma corruscae]